ncbi:attractin-like protein 1 [Palaemon carinicauda]|uniref:attractin-like protein 1 n=1 Tax=Palaemon carinicauda TaxID=392227 RepID=UPI0035B67939
MPSIQKIPLIFFFCFPIHRLFANSGTITDGSGNYSTDSHCGWLIDAGKANTSIHLHLDHFATECSWDHLYVYDGDSIYDPLIAVYSGMVAQDDYRVTHIPEVVTSSGFALLYFYSDATNNLSGFSISYRIDGCPSTVAEEVCSSKGVCTDGVCTCDAGWGGPACSVPRCPGECSGHGHCDIEQHSCQCYEGYKGVDCSQVREAGWWEVVSHDISSELEHPGPSSSLLERSSHATVLINNEIWVIGGYSFTVKPFLLRYNLTEDKWTSVETKSIKEPSARYGHTAVVYNESIYMYGGVKVDGTIANELWRLDVHALEWSEISSNHENDNTEEKASPKSRQETSGCSSLSPCAPIHCVGHASVVVQKSKEVMLVFFGHSDRYGYLNTVQEYDFEQSTWTTLETRGAVVHGVYGHTALWDPVTSLVYIHGGFQSIKTQGQVVSDLMTFDPIKLVWNLKTPAPVPRFLHSAVLVRGLMLVFGGNAHTDIASSDGAKCFSADFVAYDISCNEWHTMQKIPNLYLDIARYGHQSFVHDGAMYVVGGFNGKMLGSVLRYHLGECESLSREDCLLTFPGRKCVWNRILSRCENTSDHDVMSFNVCPPVPVKHNLTALCDAQSSCRSCLFNTYNCYWCDSTCTHNKCSEQTRAIVVSGESCEDDRRTTCRSLDTCPLCNAHQYCDWENNICDVTHNRTEVTLETTAVDGPEPNLPGIEQGEHRSAFSSGTSNALHSHRPCEPTCAQRTSCKNCTISKGSCIWCFNQQRCIDSNSYLVNFPYGQCREWTIEQKQCPKIEIDMDSAYSRCRDHQTCLDCQADVACGWCDDGSGTGIGVCMEGGQRGPIDPITSVTQPSKCPRTRWFFTRCPLCNCNGHSRCENGSQCILPCANNTAGLECQHCDEKFFGNPLNGGSCKPCDCNNHGDTCDRESGQCSCNTKGVTGDHCDRCDTYNNYFDEPLLGTCFYDLQTDYKFTFTLSKPEDRHIRQINFLNVPPKSDVDTDFKIVCSKAAKIKVSSKTGENPESWIVDNFTGTQIERRFSASEYTFGSDDDATTFHVYVYNFTTPIDIIVSFFQQPKLNINSFLSSLFSF